VYECAYDSVSALSFVVAINKLNKYYWAQNDSSYFANLQKYNYAYNDSLLYEKRTDNFGFKGIEYELQLPYSKNVNRVRQILVGEKMYTLFVAGPANILNSANSSRFFSEFKPLTATETKLFTPKHDLLLSALQSTDSATFTEAKAAVSDISFKKTDKDFLQKALIAAYPFDTTNYSQIRSTVLNALVTNSDNETVDFVKTNYEKVGKDNPRAREAMIDFLYKANTAQSCALLKRIILLGNHNFSEGYQGLRQYFSVDSLELIKTLYPEALTLLNNKYFQDAICAHTFTLLDSGMIKLEMVKPYEKQIISVLDGLLSTEKANAEKFEGWRGINYVSLLGKFSSTLSNSAINRAAQSKEAYLSQHAAIALLKNNQLVSPSILERIAGDKAFITSLYEELKTIKKQQLFPKKYANQKSYAEALIYNWTEDDYYPTKMTFVGERMAKFKNKDCKFYLFKIDYGTDDDIESYLGVAGPFDAKKPSEFAPKDDGKCTIIFTDELYDVKKVNEHFKMAIKKCSE
jgi:hypothetical protein